MGAAHLEYPGQPTVPSWKVVPRGVSELDLPLLQQVGNLGKTHYLGDPSASMYDQAQMAGEKRTTTNPS